MLSAAIEIARRDPPVIVHGDLNEGLEALARQAPPATTLVVFHSAVLTYLTARERQDFVRTVTSLPGYWLSLEGPSVAPLGGRRLPASPDPGRMLFVLECDGRPIGFADPQGSYLHWID